MRINFDLTNNILFCRINNFNQNNKITMYTQHYLYIYTFKYYILYISLSSIILYLTFSSHTLSFFLTHLFFTFALLHIFSPHIHSSLSLSLNTLYLQTFSLLTHSSLSNFISLYSLISLSTISIFLFKKMSDSFHNCLI